MDMDEMDNGLRVRWLTAGGELAGTIVFQVDTVELHLDNGDEREVSLFGDVHPDDLEVIGDPS
jgi:hypothetical protein